MVIFCIFVVLKEIEMGIKGFYTANQIVDEALLAVGDNERRRYGEAVMYFHRGYRDFNLFHNEAVTERWEPITPVHTVNLPEDFVRLLWVGVSLNGELFSFTRSNKIISPVDSPLDETLDESRGETEAIVRTPTSGYGAKAVNMEYYYTLDLERRRLVLKRPAIAVTKSSDRSEVLIGYVSHGVRQMDNTYIYADAANMLVAFIEWKLTEGKAGSVPAYLIEMKKQNYIESQRMYETLNMPSIDELYDAIYETSGQNVRL
jgi:hypothetical protein